MRRSQGYGYVSGQRRAGIRGLESKGRPLWDGTSLLRVQPASEVEIAAFRTAEAADADEEVVEGPKASQSSTWSRPRMRTLRLVEQ